MDLPFSNFDTRFENFLQELPEDYRELAVEFKAFCRSRKIKTPDQSGGEHFMLLRNGSGHDDPPATEGVHDQDKGHSSSSRSSCRIKESTLS